MTGTAGGRLAGKVALVTGAGSVGPGWGNGRAMAVIFAREGASVYLVDRDAESLEVTATQIREEGGAVTTAMADVTDPASVDAMVGGASSASAACTFWSTTWAGPGPAASASWPSTPGRTSCG